MDRSEYLQRLDKTRTAMQKDRIDALLLVNWDNITYFTNLWGFSPYRFIALVLPLEAEPFLIVPLIEAEYAESGTWVRDIESFIDWDKEGPELPAVKKIQVFLEGKGIADQVIGIEKNQLTINRFNMLKEALPKAQLEDCTGIMQRVRLIKSPQEIELLQRAGEIAIAEFEALINCAKEGIMEFELSLKATEAGSRAAAENFGDDYMHSPLIGGVQILASGKYVSMPHKMASTRRLRRGDKIQPCFCNIGFYKGYHCSFGRAISIGSPSSKDQKLYGICRKAQEEAYKVIKPGTGASEIYQVISSILREFGEGEEMHRSGRGLGLGFAELPDLSPADHTVLEPGMVFSVEPSLYMAGHNGMRIEDTVLVTDNGLRELTEYKKDFQIV